jgi:hypothetical protein
MSFQAGAEQRSAAVAQRSPPISPPETAGSSGAPICCDGTTDAAADSAAAAARALDSSAASSQQPKAKRHRRRRHSRPAAASSAPSQPSEQDVYQVGLVVNDLILFIVAADLIEWESFDVVCIRFPAMPGSRDAMYLDMARAGLIAQHPYEHLSQSFSAPPVCGRPEVRVQLLPLWGQARAFHLCRHRVLQEDVLPLGAGGFLCARDEV